MSRGFRLSPGQVVDAREAIKLADGRMTLSEAVEIALSVIGGKKIVDRSLQDALHAYLMDKKKRVSAKTLRNYDTFLTRWVESWPDNTLCRDVTSGDVQAFLEDLDLSPSGYLTYHAILRAWSNWLLKRNYILEDWTAFEVYPVKDRSPDFLSVDECRMLLAAIETSSDGRHLPAVCLMLFAGIRPEELRGLEKPAMVWSCVDFDNETIRIPPECSKTGRGRILENLPETLWRWLALRKRASGKIMKADPSQIQRVCKRAAGRWSHDILRHSFATYHVAQFSDPGKTSLLMGHEGKTGLLYRRYRGVTTASEAAGFWSL